MEPSTHGVNPNVNTCWMSGIPRAAGEPFEMTHLLLPWPAPLATTLHLPLFAVSNLTPVDPTQVCLS